MKTTISKKFDFDAAHWLPNVCEGHKCGRLHGHTYVVEIILEGEVTEPAGWFIDYADIGAVMNPLIGNLDHQCLNHLGAQVDKRALLNPTTENLCAWMFPIVKRQIPQLKSIRIYESSTTWCEVSG